MALALEKGPKVVSETGGKWLRVGLVSETRGLASILINLQRYQLQKKCFPVLVLGARFQSQVVSRTRSVTSFHQLDAPRQRMDTIEIVVPFVQASAWSFPRDLRR